MLNDEELLHIALDGLPSDYDSSNSAIRTRSDVLIVEELNTLLNAKEIAIRKRSGVIDASTMAMVANYQPPGFGRGRGRNNAQRGCGNGGRGSSFGGGGFNPNGNFNSNAFSSPFSQSQPDPPRPSRSQGLSQRPQYQICGKSGHTALDCYHRMNFSFRGKHALSKLVAMVANSSQVHMANGWLIDRGCPAHVTPNLANLSLQQQPTIGFETVTISNGQDLPVTHIGNGELCTSTHNFKLDGMLHPSLLLW